MKRADYHIHSDFSPDSTLTMDQACENAISLGLKELCFTDHFEIAGDIVIDYGKYRQAVLRARGGMESSYHSRLDWKWVFDIIVFLNI